MNVQEAVRLAKNYVTDVFVEEKITNVGLEEVEFNDMENCWEITIGFSRPWDYQTRSPFEQATDPFHTQRRPRTRSFKVVNIDADNATVLSVKNREVTGMQ